MNASPENSSSKKPTALIVVVALLVALIAVAGFTSLKGKGFAGLLKPNSGNSQTTSTADGVTVDEAKFIQAVIASNNQLIDLLKVTDEHSVDIQVKKIASDTSAQLLAQNDEAVKLLQSHSYPTKYDAKASPEFFHLLDNATIQDILNSNEKVFDLKLLNTVNRVSREVTRASQASHNSENVEIRQFSIKAMEDRTRLDGDIRSLLRSMAMKKK